MIVKALGHYQIISQIGKGGMGEIYQAKDQKLGRDVAIKVLPDEFAKDADRVARFQREAKVLASLNHPNIAAIHGLEESGGTNFLVLELVEGETLADRIKSGSIPFEEALKLALQIAEALEAAHEKGIIHRDLKPANIKVTPDGKVKVLDFGLAKAFAGDQEEVNLSNSPTLSNAATQQGVILGTAAYMSPEQARGKSVDKRADIWAFGCVLYEMLTGHVAFRGEDVSEILASVIKGDVKLDLLPGNLHLRVREVMIRCLQRDLNRRYQDIRDARYEIEQALADPSGVLVQPGTTVGLRTNLRKMLFWLAATLVLGAIIAGVAVWKLNLNEPRQLMRFDCELPEGQQFSSLSFGALAISPDGKRLVYSTYKGLYIRSVDELAPKMIAGTEESTSQPFFSPDGKWIGYYSVSDRKLKRIDVNGGVPVVLCDAEPYGESWGAGNIIVYSQAASYIMRISANGGAPEQLFKGETESRRYPQILPDGNSVMYTANYPQQPRIVVQSLKSGKRKELFAGIAARYLPTGHIVYGLSNNSNLFAIPFNLDKLEVTGGPAPIAEGVYRTVVPQYAVSDSGTLAYIPGSVLSAQRTLVWVDRSGKEQPLAAQPNDYRAIHISPDGTKLALEIDTGTKADIWVWDLIRETMTRLTFNEDSRAPLWTLDGKRVAFVTGSDASNSGVFLKAADGTGEDQELSSVQGLIPWSWSRDGKILVTLEYGGATGWGNIGSLSMEADHKWKPLLQKQYAERQPKISPDGRWMAYLSGESGKTEIYVRTFPEVNKGRWQISTNGGNSPLWSPDGRELFYRNSDSVIAVSVETGQTFKCGKPDALFRGAYTSISLQDEHTWDISPDGKRFLMLKQPGSNAGGGPRKINMVVNWFEELKQSVPVHVQ